MLHRLGSTRRPHPAAFTMVELLVVIAVLAVLISLVMVVGSKVIAQQKVSGTQQIMQNVTLALEQFAGENPLREVYDRKGRETFGKYPPYQLANRNAANSVARTLEVEHLLTRLRPATLSVRLASDLSGQRSPTESDWVEFPNEGDGNDDNRALYAYLRAFSPDSLRLIPESRLSPLNQQTSDFINPEGTGINLNDAQLDELDVLGIHDAWGVPLDYMLYVKIEWGLIRNSRTGRQYAGFRVVDRKPTVRSRGIKREVYDEWVKSNSDPTQRERRLSPPEKWLFSEPFCSPASQLTDGPDYRQGLLPGSPSPPSSAKGWARAVAANEEYAYRPDGDTPE